MARAIRLAVVERPAYRNGPLRVEGPDEDGFTLAVAALERLGDRLGSERPIERVFVTGPFPPELAPYLGEAIGRPGLEVRLAAGDEAPLFQALAAAGSPEADGTVAVVAVDTARGPSGPAGRVPYGAGAVAFAVAEGPGFAIGPHGERNHPPSRPPEARAWVAAVRRAAGPDPAPTGQLAIRAAQPAPVLLAFWQRELPGFPHALLPPPDPSLGPAPHLLPALEIAEAAAATGTGPTWVLARLTPERTRFAGFVRTGPVELLGPSESPLPASGGAPADAGPEPPGISEGAYVAKARYLEEIPSRWWFVAARCPACGRLTFPARAECRFCGTSEGLEPFPLPREGGEVEAGTTIHPGAQPTEFDALVAERGPYSVVLVRLAKDVRATLQATDAPAGSFGRGARVGSRLRRLYRSEGEWRYGRKAVPAPTGAVPTPR